MCNCMGVSSRSIAGHITVEAGIQKSNPINLRKEMRQWHVKVAVRKSVTVDAAASGNQSASRGYLAGLD